VASIGCNFLLYRALPPVVIEFFTPKRQHFLSVASCHTLVRAQSETPEAPGDDILELFDFDHEGEEDTVYS
jgi:hypothetical protein